MTILNLEIYLIKKNSLLTRWRGIRTHTSRYRGEYPYQLDQPVIIVSGEIFDILPVFTQ